MTKPDYITHQVSEASLTNDWFFTKKKTGKKIWQGILIAIGWLMCLVPMTITGVLYTVKSVPLPVDLMALRRILLQTNYYFLLYVAVFAVFFLGLFLLNKLRKYRLKKGLLRMYDPARLRQRIDLAEDMYLQKYGPLDMRHEQPQIVIPDYADVGTYELRQRFDYFEEEEDAF
ncbi:hypothetical protein CG419_09260 [Latilactobacillus curvatus]|uniref:Uncharacterized protein n=1 Tax=Latilactobacillus curvatus TaxID=28038 RepID=A0AAC9USZ9_LATCU|nr:hypothetical protein [Latilactobacillus curvatus]ASN60789.1 hypothetical protein CG419_09260 [Latilactobacillus curvatus]